MPIKVNYRPAASVVGGAAFLGGQGELGKERDKYFEQQRQYDEQQALRAAQFGEQQRQFDATQMLREQAQQIGQDQFGQTMDYNVWRQRSAIADAQNARRAAARQQQEGLAGVGSARQMAAHSPAADLAANEQKMAMAQQQAQQQAQIKMQLAQQAAEEKRAYEKFAIQQGWMEATPEFLDEQTSEITDFLEENSDYITNQAGYKKAMAELRNIHKSRGTMRPDQYADAIGQWNAQNDPGQWKIKKPPTAQETLDQSVAVTPGGVEMIVGPDRVPRPVPQPKVEKTEKPKEPKPSWKTDPVLRSEFRAKTRDYLQKIEDARYEAQMDAYTAKQDAYIQQLGVEGANPVAPAGEVPVRRVVSDSEVQGYMQSLDEETQPLPDTGDLASDWAESAEGPVAAAGWDRVSQPVTMTGDGSVQSPIVFSRPLTREEAEVLRRQYAGAVVIDPETGKHVLLPE